MKNRRQQKPILYRIYWTIILPRNQLMDVFVIIVNRIRENSSNIVWKNYRGKIDARMNACIFVQNFNFLFKTLAYYEKCSRRIAISVQRRSSSGLSVNDQCSTFLFNEYMSIRHDSWRRRITEFERITSTTWTTSRIDWRETSETRFESIRKYGNYNREFLQAWFDVISRKSMKTNISLLLMVIIDFLLWLIITADRVMLVRIESSSICPIYSLSLFRTLYIHCLWCKKWCLVDIWWYISNIMYWRTCSDKSSFRCLRCDVHASVCIWLLAKDLSSLFSVL